MDIYSKEAEEAVLGSMLLEPDKILTAVRLGLKPECFHDRSNRMLFDAMSKMDGQLDTLIIAQKLADAGNLERIGGYNRLSELQEIALVPAYMESYAGTVLEKYRLRMIVDNAQAAIEAAENGEESFAVAQKLSDITLHAEKPDDIYDTARDAYDLDSRIAHGERVGLPFP